MNFWPRIIGNY